MRELLTPQWVASPQRPGAAMRRVLSRRLLLAAALALPTWVKAQAAAASAPRRIVSVGGALTELLYELGAERELVGVDSTSLHPAAARSLASVGYARALSAEGVLSLRPTLLVASSEAGPPAVMQQLAATRLAVETVDLDHRVEGLFAAVPRLARLVGRVGEGDVLLARLRSEWAMAQTQVNAARQAGPAPRVLFVLSHSMAQVRIAGQDTAADAMITLAGARNAFADTRGYKPLAPEAAIAAAPDVILATEQGLAAAGGVDGLLKAPGLAQTPAGRERRVVSLEALYLLGFGPRLPQAVAELAQRLHRRA
jgi:iron complex transport system substrate-binding protein